MSSATTGGRWLILASLVAIPLVNFLIRNRYSLVRPEALAPLAMLAVVCLLLAAAARHRTAFYALVAACAGVVGGPAVGYALGADAAPAYAAMGTALAVGVALAMLREKTFGVLAAVAAASCVAALVEQLPSTAQSAAAVGRAQGHLLYIIFDEHLGLGGFPRDIAECSDAAGALAATLERHNLTVYPNAYSNYAVTIDSLPSVLNRTLLAHSRQKIRQSANGALIYSLDENALLEGERQSYVLQHGSLDLGAGPGATRREYRDVLGNLQRAPGGWWTKAQWIIGAYQASDPMMRAVRGFFPFRAGGHVTGPLALGTLWPGGLAEDILGAARPTLFLAHLLMPHHPYVFRKDGSVRDFEDWAGDRADRRLGPDAYRDHYRRYCERVEYLANQLDGFVATLERAGIWDSMTVVLHGDHGSRIRGDFPAGAYDLTQQTSPERYDYAGEPNQRDLMDRFSALLAMKRPLQAGPAVVREQGSLLQFLERDFYQSTGGALDPATSGVYLFSPAGALHPIPIQKYWRP